MTDSGQQHYVGITEYKIPEDLLDQWTALAPNKSAPISLTRADLDKLFLGLLKTVYSLDAMQTAIHAIKLGDENTYESQMKWSMQQKVEATNFLRNFMQRIMHLYIESGDG